MLQDEERLIAEQSTEEAGNTTCVTDYSSAEFHTSRSLGITIQKGAGKRFSILEPAVLINFIAIFLSGAVIQNQILFQTCVATYHYNESDCEPLQGVIPKTEEAKHIENEVQPYAANIIMGRSLMNSLLPAFLSLIIGPWSDKFGRRPVLLLGYCACFIGYITMTTLAAISTNIQFNPWLYLIADIPSAITGGGCAITIMVLCYVSDVTDDRNKAKRMFFIDAAMGIGLIIGNIASGFLLAATNTITVLGISSLLSFVAFIFVFFFIKESLTVLPSSTKTAHAKLMAKFMPTTLAREAQMMWLLTLTVLSKIRALFNFGLIKDLVYTCLARRPNYDRSIIWLVTISSVITSFILQGESNVFYLFLRNKFNVTLQDYTQFNAIVICSKMVGCTSSLILFKRILKVPLPVIAMLGFGGSVLESTVRTTAQKFWEIYLSATLGSFGSLATPMLQAILAVIVPAPEFGKIYALTTSLQTVAPLGSAPLYTTLYNLTLNSYPALFNIVSAALYLFCFTFVTCIFWIQKSLVKTAKLSTVEA